MFTDDQPSFNAHNYAHSNGKTKENIPLTPITLQPKDQEPNVFRIQDFQTIQSEYLHPETEEDKRLVEEDQEIEYHENMEAYCRVGQPKISYNYCQYYYCYYVQTFAGLVSTIAWYTRAGSVAPVSTCQQHFTQIL